MQYKNATNRKVVMIPAIVFALIALTATGAFARGSREMPQRPGSGREIGEDGVVEDQWRGRDGAPAWGDPSWEDRGWGSGWGGRHHARGSGRHHGRGDRGWGGGRHHHRDDRFGERSEWERISAETAQRRLEEAVREFGNGGYEIVEIMEFENDFYAQVRRHGSDINAFELIVDAYTGRVSPEPGPNMMWNTEYGHMGRGRFSWGSAMDAERAKEIGNDYVVRYSTTASVDDLKPFPGYYTMHVFDNGEIVGMLSVNARNGRVWYHDWHGAFRQMVVGHDH